MGFPSHKSLFFEEKDLLPLKKGGWEGFLGRPFQNAKALQGVKAFDGLCARRNQRGVAEAVKGQKRFPPSKHLLTEEFYFCCKMTRSPST